VRSRSTWAGTLSFLRLETMEFHGDFNGGKGRLIVKIRAPPTRAGNSSVLKKVGEYGRGQKKKKRGKPEIRNRDIGDFGDRASR